jgi:putative heme iron utilization protein
MADSSESEEALQSEIREFREGFRSVTLATVNGDGVPEASYAPCVTDAAGNHYVFVSGLARHTRDLEETGTASALFIEDEQSAGNIFARKRLSYRCDAILVPRESPEWEAILKEFREIFGRFVETLQQLPDFRLFRLSPRSGRYVSGFGQAFELEGQRVTQLRPQGRETGAADKRGG